MYITEKIDMLLGEGKSDYEIYHGSYSAAVQEIEKFALKNGYTLDSTDDPEMQGDQMYNKVGRGPTKPTGGKTNRFSFELYKGNKKQRKMLHAQVYGEGNRFELNMYIN